MASPFLNRRLVEQVLAALLWIPVVATVHLAPPARHERPRPKRGSTYQILVAARDLPEQHVLASDDIMQITITDETGLYPPPVLVDVEAVVGRPLAKPLRKFQQLCPEMLQ